ncbi:RagB/SusD family nutrient uptake outer membrane protein, partial [Bacteroides uniformis]
MKILKYKYILSAALLSTMLGVTSCVNDLDTVPLDKDELVSDVVFGKEIGAYEQSLAKIYAGLVIGGNAGGDSDQDVVGIDGGSQASFIRVLWNMQ